MKHFLNDNGLSSFTSVLDLLHTWDNENCEYDSYPSMLSLLSRTSSIVNWSSKSANSLDYHPNLWMRSRYDQIDWW